MEIVRFCLIGAGRAGMVHANNIVHNIKNATLAAIVENEQKVLEECGRELGVEHLFRSVDDALQKDLFDAVVVVTPTFTHREIAVKCAGARKHIFCEKPMSVRVEEAREMIEAAEKSGVKLQIGFMRRFDQSFRKAREIIAGGELGEVMLIKSVGRGPGLPPSWSYDVEASNGVLGEVNSHDFDSTRWLAASEYARVYAEAVNRKAGHLRKDYPGFYDNAVVAVRFKNEVIGTIDGTCPAEYGYDARTEVLLTKGFISIGETKGESMFSCDSKGNLRSTAFASWRNRFKDAYVEELRSFIRCVLHGAHPEVSGLDGLRAVEVVVAANRSIMSGMPVEVETGA